MSAYLRYDIPMDLHACLLDYRVDVYGLNGSFNVPRMCGPRRERWVVSFAIKLPDSVGFACELVRACGSILMSGRFGPAATLRRKLLVSLGLPYSGDEVPRTEPLLPGEYGFIHALTIAPEDLTTWLVYADWLEERNESRGTVIRWWVDPKVPMRVKRGVPECVRHLIAGKSGCGPVKKRGRSGGKRD